VADAVAQVESKVEDHVATITLNRPDALNALSSSLLDDLDSAVARLDEDPDVHGAIVTGAGRAFVAGADIEEIHALDRASGSAFALRGQGVFTRIERLDKPVIAAVNGFALGGGCELAMACHVRIASTRARFGQPEVKLGILPGFGGTQRLPRIVGRGLATEITLSGRMVDAEEALRIGLVNQVVEPDDLQARAREVLGTILANGPRAVAASLVAIREGLDMTLDEGLALEAKLFAECCGSDEMKEGTRAFLDKREPSFRP
jgi:enoyl-CoA hydratase